MSLPLEPAQVNDLLNAMEVARAAHGDDAPDTSLAERAIRAAAATGVALTFVRVLNDEGTMVWEAVLSTRRGEVRRTPDEGQDWQGVLDGLLGSDW